MPKKKVQMEIDGIVFESVGAVAKAYGLTYTALQSRMRKNRKTVYTSKELGLEGVQPKHTGVVANCSNILSWAFVYSQLASSPKRRGVDSGSYSQAA